MCKAVIVILHLQKPLLPLAEIHANVSHSVGPFPTECDKGYTFCCSHGICTTLSISCIKFRETVKLQLTGLFLYAPGVASVNEPLKYEPSISHTS